MTAHYISRKPYRGPVTAVILDWAGTAVDYGSIGPVSVFLDVFDRHKVEITVDEARSCMGLMKKDHIRTLCRLDSVSQKWRRVHGRAPDEDDVENMFQEMEPLMAASVSKHAELIPGLLEFVQALRERDIQIGSSTGYTKSIMDQLVPEAWKRGFIPDAVVCSSDVPAGRPHPWMCFQNAMALNAYPMASMIKIGDTLSDIHEGLNAGMWTVGVCQSGNELGLSEAQVQASPAQDLEQRLADIAQRFVAAGAHYSAKGIWECLPIVDAVGQRINRGEHPFYELYGSDGWI